MAHLGSIGPQREHAMLLGPAPCDACKFAAKCAAGMCCERFALFLVGAGEPRWKVAPRAPSRARFAALFPPLVDTEARRQARLERLRLARLKRARVRAHPAIAEVSATTTRAAASCGAGRLVDKVPPCVSLRRLQRLGRIDKRRVAVWRLRRVFRFHERQTNRNEAERKVCAPSQSS